MIVAAALLPSLVAVTVAAPGETPVIRARPPDPPITVATAGLLELHAIWRDRTTLPAASRKRAVSRTVPPRGPSGIVAERGVISTEATGVSVAATKIVATPGPVIELPA